MFNPASRTFTHGTIFIYILVLVQDQTEFYFTQAWHVFDFICL